MGLLQRIAEWVYGPRPVFHERFTLVITGDYIALPLSQCQTAFISSEDLELISKYTWHASDSGHGAKHKWYVASRENTRKVYMHRMLMKCPKGMVVDHIDGNGLNNTRGNLRIVTARNNFVLNLFEKKKLCQVNPLLK